MREKRADPELGFSANHVHVRGFPELCKPIGFLTNFRARVRAWLKPAAGSEDEGFSSSTGFKL